MVSAFSMLRFWLYTTLEKWVVRSFNRSFEKAHHYQPVASFQAHLAAFNPVDPSLPQKLSNCSQPYFTLLTPEDTLEIGLIEILSSSEADILYFDQKVQGNGSPCFLKPEWSPELWMNVDLLYGAVYRTAFGREMLVRFGAMWLAATVLNADKIHHLPKVMLQSIVFPWQSDPLRHQHAQTIIDFCKLQKINPPTIAYRPNGSLQLNWLPSSQLVSIIIPNRNQAGLLHRCLASIYRLTSQATYEIIVVDDHSQDAQTLALYRQYTDQKPNFRVIDGKTPFNFSRACNQGAQVAQGDLLLFLNNDTEILSASWLQNLIGWANLPGVGAVGAKLLYPNGRVQHAGVVIGLEGHASHVFSGIQDDPFTPYGHVDWTRNVSAVTAACMLVPREAFWQVGGFDEQFTIAFGDIDLCLRLQDRGYRIVYTPDSVLIHHEGKSRRKYIPRSDIVAKKDYFMEKVAKGDPYYHPDLSRAWRVPSLRWQGEQDPVERLKRIIQYLGKI